MKASEQLKVARLLLDKFVKQLEGDAPTRGGIALRYQPMVEAARALLSQPEPDE